MNRKRIRKIALEEHFMAPGFQDYAKVNVPHLDPEPYAQFASRLPEFDEMRLGEMDRAGIDIAILSQTGPGVQIETNLQTAIRRAAENNDFLAGQVARHPTRYAGFAMLPMQDPKSAGDELERCVKQLGFKGSLVNGHTNGVYYDDPMYDAFWERMQELDVPMYIHPADPYKFLPPYADHPELEGPVWSWGVETATHTLRLLFGGVFDRFPNLKIILGHMGEGLPFQRWRLDSRFAVCTHGIKLKRQPSEYIGSNVIVTTAGVCSTAALQCAISELGAESVLFSTDYPFENVALAAEFIEVAPLSQEVRELVCYKNAERIFRL